jgi:Ca2+-binding EF-hand superfamily protein
MEVMEGYNKFFGRSLGMDDVEKIFDAVDFDKSGSISYSEFVIL